MHIPSDTIIPSHRNDQYLNNKNACFVPLFGVGSILPKRRRRESLGFSWLQLHTVKGLKLNYLFTTFGADFFFFFFDNVYSGFTYTHVLPAIFRKNVDL